MNSMVRLKNIKKSDGTIECDIYPEDSTLPGHVVVSIKTEAIIKPTQIRSSITRFIIFF